LNKRDFFKCDYEQIVQIIDRIDWSALYVSDDVDSAYSILHFSIQAVINEHCPTTPASSTYQKKSTLPLPIRRLYNDKLRRYRAIRNDSDKISYRKFVKSCDVQVDKFYSEIETKAVESDDTFYRYLRNKFGSSNDVLALKDADGNTISDPIMMANLFARQFAAVFSHEPVKPSVQFMPNVARREKFIISQKSVTAGIMKLKDKATRTPDQIPPIFLRKTVNVIVKPLCHIFQLSVDSGKVPFLWRHYLVNPLFKKGNRSEPLNYRPIALTSAVCKILESIVKDFILEHFHKHKLLADEQHGFRSGRSTVTCLLQSNSKWISELHDHRKLYILYLDFSKAFDVVPHDKLIDKLRRYQLSEILISWVEDFLKNRTLAVSVSHHDSSPEEVLSGVIQGSVIGPLLFSIYINDLPQAVRIPGVDLEIFADDTKLYSSDITKLQQAADCVATWCTEWGMKLAPEKSTLVAIDRALSPNPVNITIDGITVPQANVVRDLGVLTNNHLDPSDQCLAVVRKAQRIGGLITRTLRTKKLSVYRKAYVSLVRPKLEYATEIWSPYTIRDTNIVENVQRGFTRRIFYKCGLNKTSYANRLKKFNLPTLENRRMKTDLTMAYKIVNKIADFPETVIFRRLPRKTRGHMCKVKSVIPIYNDMSKNCYANRIVNLWNSLPARIIQAPNVTSFKRMLQKLDISNLFESKIRT
jgi:ribonuclease P/MRP protein subunit RPP40